MKNIKSIERFERFFFEEPKTDELFSISNYSETGLLINEIHYDNEGKISVRYDFLYTKRGEKLEVKSTFSQHELHIEKYNYKDDLLIKKEEFFNEKECIEEF